MRKVIFILLLSFVIAGIIGCGGDSSEDAKKGAGGPKVSNSIPKNGASNVSTTTMILVTFDKDIAPPSTANLTLTPDASGIVSYSSDTRTMVFKPSAALSKNTNYTMTIKDITDLEGNVISPVTISFITSEPDTISPKIISTSPVNNQEDVGQDAKILIKFSEPIDIDKFRKGISFDPTTNTSSDQWLFERSGDNNEDVIISPLSGTEPFNVNEKYTLIINRDSVVDLSGNSMITDYNIIFNTLKYPVEKILNPNFANPNVEPLWFYTVGKVGGKWVVSWGSSPPPGASSLNNPSGTITASSDGQISDSVDTFSTRAEDHFNPTVSSGNGNRLSFSTAALDNQKSFRMIFSSTSSYLTFDLRSSSGTVPAQYVQIGGDMVHPSRTPFIMKNK